MNWQQVCETAELQNLPFKFELNERGQIIMSPVKVNHSLFQGEIEYWLRKSLKKGKTFPECAIKTRKGTKVADVVWASPERVEQIKHQAECLIAPEICIEVLSESNSDEEMREKQALYFEQAAQEVWICNEDGVISFYTPNGQVAHSALAPQFPQIVKI